MELKLTTSFAFAMLTVAALFVACENKPSPVVPEDDTPSPETLTLTAPALSANNTSVTLDEAKAGEEVLKLSWTSALSDGDTEPVSYTLYAASEGKDLLTSSQKFEAGNALEKVFTGEALQSLSSNFGIKDEGKILFGVYAVANNGTYEPKLSNVVAVSVSFKVIDENIDDEIDEDPLTGPGKIYLSGSALSENGNLGFSEDNVLLNVSSGVFVGDVTLYLDHDDRGLKLYGQPDLSPKVWSADLSSGAEFRIVQGDNEPFYPHRFGYKLGFYRITADFNEMKVSMFIPME